MTPPPNSRRAFLAGSAGVLLSTLAVGCSSTPDRVVAPPAAPLPTIEPAGLPRPAATDDVVVGTAAVPAVMVYNSPGGDITHTVPNPAPSGAAAVFLVQERQVNWTRAFIPTAHVHSGWILAEQLTYARHAYRIVVELERHRLVLFEGAQVVRVERAGIGTVNTPTPAGTYYTTELLQSPEPDGFYGPFAIGLNGFTGAPADADGLNGQMGLHGTNDPTTLGRNVTLGCVRVSNDAIRALAAILPLGVPVAVV